MQLRRVCETRTGSSLFGESLEGVSFRPYPALWRYKQWLQNFLYFTVGQLFCNSRLLRKLVFEGKEVWILIAMEIQILSYSFFHWRGRLNQKSFFLDRRQRGPIRSLLLVIIGWLVGCLVGNAVFSETALRIFLIFCMKLGDYKCSKVTEPGFWKNLDLEISSKDDFFGF